MNRKEIVEKATDKIVKEAKWPAFKSPFKIIAKNIAKGVVKPTKDVAEDAKLIKNIATSVEANLKAVSAYSAITLGGGLFLESLLDQLTDLKVKRKSPMYYQQMLAAHPELKKQKPAVIAKLWASLYHFAPSMAADPLAAGAFIRQTLVQGYMESVGGPPTETLSTLTGIEKGMRSLDKDRGLLKGLIGVTPKKLWEPMMPDVKGFQEAMSPKIKGSKKRFKSKLV